MGNRSPSRLLAFSLLEVLVVVSISGLLLAIILPSLSQARRESQRIQCQANLRQLAVASLAYSVQDQRQLVLPVHPTADTNPEFDDGFFDFGGLDGSPSAFEGALSAAGNRRMETRPLNAFVGAGVASHSTTSNIFRCPSDDGFNPPADYPNWPVWDPALRTMSALEAVGTSYWGNACKRRELESGRMHSFSPYLRPLARIPSTSDTVLYMEMPALFNVSLLPSSDGVVLLTLGATGWHAPSPVFNLAFCDGRVAGVNMPATSPFLNSAVNPRPTEHTVRTGGVRFDCFPDAPIVDPPIDAEL